MVITVGMKHLIAVFIIILNCVYPAMSRTVYEASVDKHEQWMAKYGRSYADAAEKEKRFKIFMDNLEYIENFNNAAGNKSYTLGLNQFSDLTREEFLASHTGLKISSIPESSMIASYKTFDLSEVPTSMDWREMGAVTQIKDQRQCGCCWVFSAVAVVEGIVQIKTGKLISLSEQQLVDCARNDQNKGCDGGWMDNAFEYIRNNGIADETNYPYGGTEGTCDTSKANLLAAQISGYEDVTPNSEEQLLQAVSNQPVSVAISLNDLFRSYSSGIFEGPCEFTSYDHAVTLIGYGTAEDGTKYWLIKNSWGESWGENGYMKLQRDNGVAEGLCGIAMKASYPTA